MAGFSIVQSAHSTQIYGDRDGLTMLRDAIDDAIERGVATKLDNGGHAGVVIIREEVWKPR